MKWDYPEFGLAGVKPHAVSERYYFSRGPQLVNRVVDIGDYIDRKVWVNLANITLTPNGPSDVLAGIIVGAAGWAPKERVSQPCRQKNTSIPTLPLTEPMKAV
jgi:hypothetical protein